jgi:hypothetical protein
LDTPFEVQYWSTPKRERVDTTPRADGAPPWWHGEDAANAEFMRAMGLTFNEKGEVVKK